MCVSSSLHKKMSGARIAKKYFLQKKRDKLQKMESVTNAATQPNCHQEIMLPESPRTLQELTFDKLPRFVKERCDSKPGQLNLDLIIRLLEINSKLNKVKGSTPAPREFTEDVNAVPSPFNPFYRVITYRRQTDMTEMALYRSTGRLRGYPVFSGVSHTGEAVFRIDSPDILEFWCEFNLSKVELKEALNEIEEQENQYQGEESRNSGEENDKENSESENEENQKKRAGRGGKRKRRGKGRARVWTRIKKSKKSTCQ